METINNADIIRKAREMRGEEMRHLLALLAGHIAHNFGQLANAATAAGKALRPLFSGNPQAHRS